MAFRWQRLSVKLIILRQQEQRDHRHENLYPAMSAPMIPAVCSDYLIQQRDKGCKAGILCGHCPCPCRQFPERKGRIILPAFWLAQGDDPAALYTDTGRLLLIRFMALSRHRWVEKVQMT